MNISSANRRARHGLPVAIIGIGLIVAAAVGGFRYLTGDVIEPSPQPVVSGPPASVGADVGNAFPSFRLTEVGGSALSKETLAGKPALLWFTTSWCVPCQVGAKKVAELDSALGGDAFDVIVVFVDPGDEPAKLIRWRDRFANDDWMVAIDSPSDSVARKVNLRFLDSKYLLDAHGVIQDVDFQIAGEEYLDTIRLVVGKS